MLPEQVLQVSSQFGYTQLPTFGSAAKPVEHIHIPGLLVSSSALGLQLSQLVALVEHVKHVSSHTSQVGAVPKYPSSHTHDSGGVPVASLLFVRHELHLSAPASEHVKHAESH